MRTIFVTLAAVLNAAVDDGLIAKNPCKAGSVRTPRVDVRQLEAWSASQVAAVIEQLPPRYRALAVAAAGCGLRQGEVFGLRVQDVDFLQRRIKVEQQVKLLRGQVLIDRPKGGRTRVVPMPDAIALELSEHLRRHPAERHELVFRSREGKPMSRNSFNHHVWRPAVTRAGIEAGRPNGMHALRHFYASVLIDAGESVKAVAEFLGHRDAGFTLRVYAHLFPSSDDRARLAVDGVLGPALKGSEGRIGTARQTRPSGAPTDS